MTTTATSPRRTPLHPLHTARGGRMIDFAGWALPLDYSGSGIIQEHRHTRRAASLFDVSHMGVVQLRGGDPDHALERLAPAHVVGIEPGRLCYSFLTTESGGVLDDVVITTGDKVITVVLNAARTAVDIVHLLGHLPPSIALDIRDDLGLVALQGPRAAAVLAAIAPAATRLPFMRAAEVMLPQGLATITRSGYTGEDGFEILAPGPVLMGFAEQIMGGLDVGLAGLGARDTLRLEAGLCLYGNDLSESITPVEAGLGWAIGRRRREQGGFLGDATILDQLRRGPSRVRAGLRPTGRRPVRPGCRLLSPTGDDVGFISSGGFGPTIDGPIAMGYVRSELADLGTRLLARNAARPELDAVEVVSLPFVPHRYHRSA